MSDAPSGELLDLERATRSADPRVRGVEYAGYGDTAVEAAVASSLGVAATSRRTMCSCSSFAMAGDADETQTGYGFSAGRAFDDLDAADAASTAASRASASASLSSVAVAASRSS